MSPQTEIEKDTTAVSVVPEIHKGDPDLDTAEEVIHAETEYTEEEYKKLRRKFDFTLLPVMMLVYGLQFSDKISLSSGVIFGLLPDTGMNASQYSLLTVFFYVAYLVGQLPMNYALQRWPLGKGLGCIIIAWGTAVLGMGFCNTYGELSACRVLLGWFEAPITTRFLLIVASWYKREESTLRSSCFFAMNTFLGGIFNLIIYGLAKHAEESGGPSGWRVINWFLGGLTMFSGVLVLIFIGTPQEVWWLNKEQKRMVHARIVGNATGGGESRAWDWAQAKECVRDPQFYFIIIFGLSAQIPNGVLTTFSTLIYKGFGFTPLETILYGLPANYFGFTVIIGSALVVTRWQRARFPLAMMWSSVGVIIYLYIGVGNGNKWQKWAAYMWSTTPTVPTFLIWPMITTNAAGRTKKTVLGATTFIIYCAGNMIGSQIVRPSDAPRYLKSLTAGSVVLIVKTASLGAWWLYYMRENKRRDAEQQAAGITEEERLHLNKLAGETDQTDRQNRHFRYLC
ncbi:hypothetical protein I316_04456 [Kwoniella heveanensis BCC8398]|uniref:Major facilitator superfamily (MFS) profile domain-containing protein n=1 Tax=Kwoniella heveanensis BCC8398 TaxID=1296120 RepID=A0A1B9GRQ0_9TREE|nr:hypothetical protein I316_04456 [Kwoniella heveanensis BCC8398]